jgi:two-component system sensor histidine kinase UhpB
MALIHVCGDTAAPAPSDSRRSAKKRGWSLYMRAVLTASVILLVATLLLLWTPVTISAPVSTRQAGLLTAGLVIMVALNAAMLKLRFRDLEALAHRMDDLDLLL